MEATGFLHPGRTVGCLCPCGDFRWWRVWSGRYNIHHCARFHDIQHFDHYNNHGTDYNLVIHHNIVVNDYDIPSYYNDEALYNNHGQTDDDDDDIKADDDSYDG